MPPLGRRGAGFNRLEDRPQLGFGRRALAELEVGSGQRHSNLRRGNGANARGQAARLREKLDGLRRPSLCEHGVSPIETEYKKLSPTPDDFPNFVQRIVATASKGYDFGADKLEATTTPMFFIHGDADGVRLAHVAEMFLLKGGEIHGDMKPRSASRLAILPTPPT